MAVNLEPVRRKAVGRAFRYEGYNQISNQRVSQACAPL